MPFKRNTMYKRKRPSANRFSKNKKFRPSINWSKKSMTNNKIVSIPGDYPFPQRLKSQMVYQNKFNVTFAAGAATTVVFRGNSIFDPDQGVTSVKANAIDIVSGIYSLYGVIGSKMEVTFANGELVPIRCYVFPYQTSLLTDLNFATVSAVPNNVTTIVPTAAGGGVRKLTKYMSTRDMLNVDPATDDSVQALMTVNPANQWYWHVYGRPVDDATTSGCTFIVKITYYCLFSNRKVIPYV